MKVTFTGRNESGYTNCWGYHFPCGEAVEVDDKDALEEARRHPEFKVAEAAPKSEPKPAPKQRRKSK